MRKSLLTQACFPTPMDHMWPNTWFLTLGWGLKWHSSLASIYIPVCQTKLHTTGRNQRKLPQRQPPTCRFKTVTWTKKTLSNKQMLSQMDKFHVQTKNTKRRHYRNGKKPKMGFWRKGDKMKTEKYRMVSFSCPGRWAHTAVITEVGERGWTVLVFPTFMHYHFEPHWQEGTNRSIFP